MAFAGEEARSRIEPDPTGARQVHLGPGMQIGKVRGRAGGAIERFDVGAQLNQIAGDKAGGEAQIAQDLHQQPASVAAGSTAGGERELGRLDAGLHANQIADVALQPLVQHHQEVIGGHGHPRHRGEPTGQQRSGGGMGHEGS